MTCAIIGDSIAVGLALAAPYCEHHARVGITSAQFINTYVEEVKADTVVISLGANDVPARVGIVSEYFNFKELRERITAKTVYWLMPAEFIESHVAIKLIANDFGDNVIDMRNYSPRLHPARNDDLRLARDLQL